MHEPERVSTPLLRIYEKASLIRLAGDRIVGLIRTGRLAAPYYSPRGQEIVAASMAAALNDDDYWLSTYRGLHDQLAKGVPLRLLIAEYLGRITGACKGKGGPMHISHPASGLMVTTGIVGSGMPIANGLAWASVIKGLRRVTVVSFGDGASNIGAFHEALNLASLWKLPVIFFCQNNGYGEHTRYETATSVAHIAERARSYSMRGVTVDGNDPDALWRAASDAVERARNGEGPTLLEARTFRFEGHVYGDPGHYIPKPDFELAKTHDPVPLLRHRLLAQGFSTATELDQMELLQIQRIEEAIQMSLADPLPDATELLTDVFATVPEVFATVPDV